MKLLHTADLHIGKSLAGFSLIQDQEFILDRILDIISKEKPRVLLIAGDVYDKQIPPVEAVSLFNRFLTNVVNNNVIVMIIAGNHDSPERLGFGGDLLEKTGVYIVSEPKAAVIDGVQFHLLPYVKPALARRLYPDNDITDYPGAVSAALEYLKTLTAKDMIKTERRILLAHQFFISRNFDPILSESETSFAGGLDAVDINLIRDYDYVALGHLHAPQSVGSPNIRYAGSPIKYSFSECSHVKSVALIETDINYEPEIKLIPLPSLRDMRRIRGPLEALISPEITEAGDSGDYLHVTLTDDTEVLDAMEKLRSVYPNIMRLNYDNIRTSLADDSPELSDERIGTTGELFQEFFIARNNVEMTEEQIGIVKRLLEEEV